MCMGVITINLVWTFFCSLPLVIYVNWPHTHTHKSLEYISLAMHYFISLVVLPLTFCVFLVFIFSWVDVLKTIKSEWKLIYGDWEMYVRIEIQTFLTIYIIISFDFLNNLRKCPPVVLNSDRILLLLLYFHFINWMYVNGCDAKIK